jgi:hypothetical protein
MSGPRVTPDNHSARGLVGIRARETNERGLVTNVQDSDNLLAIVPAQLANELDARNQVHSAAGPEEQPVALNQKARHTHCLGICYSNDR